MEPISMMLTSALGYILKAASESKVAGTVKEEILGKFWNWIRPHFINADNLIETTPDRPETEKKTEQHLLELIKDEAFFNELIQHVEDLKKAGVKEKNNVRGSIINAKKIHIGDKVYSPNESYDRKNIVDGNVEGSDEFILGDGH